MTDESSGKDDGWGGSAWDPRPASGPDRVADGGAQDSGPPKPDQNAASGAPEGAPGGGQSGPSKPEDETTEQSEQFRGRESPGGYEARRQQWAGARYSSTYNYYHYDNSGPAPAGIRVGRVDVRELTDARGDFQQPDFYPRAVEMLGQRGVVVLAYGLSDRSRRRAALNLLGSGAEPVAEIDPRADLTGLASFAFESGGRYLAMVATDVGAHALGQFALDRLREQLTRCRSRLVLVVASRLRLPSEELGDYGVVCGDPVAAWFDAEQRKMDDYALLLAVAVLGGISHQAVVDAADRLYRSLVEEVADEATTKRRIFDAISQQSAEAVNAEVRDWEDETEFGTISTKIVEFADKDWYSAVLRYVWEHKERMRRPLVHWIEDLCAQGEEDVARGAAAAAGDLCCYDFGYMWHHVIVRWARSDDHVLRRAAARAAGIPAWDARLAPHVLGWLERWAENEDDAALRWTAAAAFGNWWIGRRFLDDALRVMGTMLEREHDLWLHIADGMSALFEGDREERSEHEGGEHEIEARVLQTLVDWSTDRRRMPWTLGVFCTIAYGNDRPWSWKDGAGWPAVLWLADRDPSMRQAIVTLFRGSLGDRASKLFALQVVERWTSRADDDSGTGIEGALSSLLRDMCVTHREWRRLTIHLRKLASERASRPSRAASRLLARLMAAEPVAAH